MITSKEVYYTFQFTEDPQDPVQIFLNEGTNPELHKTSPHLLANDVAKFIAYIRITSSSPSGFLYPPSFTFTHQVFNWAEFELHNLETNFLSY